MLHEAVLKRTHGHCSVARLDGVTVNSKKARQLETATAELSAMVASCGEKTLGAIHGAEAYSIHLFFSFIP